MIAIRLDGQLFRTDELTFRQWLYERRVNASAGSRVAGVGPLLVRFIGRWSAP
jgi:hypothetical protein